MASRTPEVAPTWKTVEDSAGALLRKAAVAAVAVMLAAIPALAAAQAPSYAPQFLASATPSEMNASAEIIGGTTAGSALRAFVVGPSHPYELLPLPVNMASSSAIDINDAGVIVGAVSANYSPEFGGTAAAWYPDGTGGYTIQILGRLPGHVLSLATAVNNVGDIVGYSSNGTFRYPVLFAPGGPVDLSATGVFDPVDVNDSRILVDHSFTAKRLDLNTMVAEDLGVPGGGGYRATRAEAINEAGQVAGAAILTTSTSCDRKAARYTDGIGWEIFSSCGPNNSAYDLNDLGDVMMRLNVDVYVRFNDLGSFRVQDLIASDDGQWYVVNSYGIAINNARQMAVFATNPTTGQSGTVLLTRQPTGVDPGSGSGWRPDASGGGATLSLRNSPEPFTSSTILRFSLAEPASAVIRIYDSSGRLVATPLEAVVPAGDQEVHWNGESARGDRLGSGIYLAELEAAGVRRTTRMTIVR